MCSWDDLMFGGRRDDRRRVRFICECREVRGDRDRCRCGRSNRREDFICRCRER